MIDYDPQDPSLTAFQQSAWERRHHESNMREVLRGLGLLGEMDRIEADPIPDCELTLREDV